MWEKLRNRRFDNLKFRRQHPVPPYIVDFFCEELELVVELDGGQHTEETDRARNDFLQKKGCRVIRFWNNDVLGNIEGVMTKLKEETASLSLREKTGVREKQTEPSVQASPHPNPLPEGEGAKRICLGEISTAHGVRGLVRIRIYGDDPQAFSAYGPLFISESGEKTLSIRMKNAAHKFWLAEVEGVADRNAAELLRGTKLWIERDKLPATENDDEFYYEDLIGMNVHTAEDGDIGTVVAVENFGASDLLEVKPVAGATFYVPFADEYIVEVNMKTNIITAIIPQGLRD